MIVVTGGAGFIGSHLVRRLAGEGQQVVVLDSFDDYYDPDRKWRNVSPLVAAGKVEVVVGDIRDAREVERVIRPGAGIECVVHLAARAGVRPSLADPALYMDVNVTGTMRVLEATRKAGIERAVLASSSSIYGDTERVPFREDESEGIPASPYGASKMAMEVVAHNYALLYRMRITALRFFTAYGPGQRPDMAIHKFARQIERGEPLAVFGKGDTRRDYTYVEDVVDGIARAMARADGPLFRAYNLGREETVELTTLLDSLERAIGKKSVRAHQEEQKGDVRVTSADCSRARRELGYQPKVSLDQGLAEFVRWLRAEG